MSPRSGEGASLSEVVVVARRTEENLQLVPLSVTAIGAVELRNAGVASGLELQKLVPSLSVNQSPANTGVGYSLRGIRSGVITYLGEVPMSSRASEQQIWDLQSVQALAGPQGTLFGRNSTGGAILFIPQKPTASLEGYVDVRAGNLESVEITGAVNIPLSDILMVRAAGRTIRRDGYVDNLAGRDLGSRHRDAFRLAALFQPANWLSNYTIFDYAKSNETPPANIVTYPLAFGPTTALGRFYGPGVATAAVVAQSALGPRTVNDPFQGYRRTKTWGISNVLTVDAGPVTAKYIFGRREETSFHSVNFASLPTPFGLSEYFVPRQNTTTHEAQLLGKMFEDRLDWVVGFFRASNVIDNNSAVQIPAPVGTFVLNRNLSIQSFGTTRSVSLAYYGQASFALTDQLKVTGGVRNTRDESGGRNLTALLPAILLGLPPSLPPIAIQRNGRQDQASSATTYTIALDYQLTPDVLLYATTRTGYNAGGFNAVIPIPPFNTYTPEKIRDYEGGVKSTGSIADMPFRANGSIFYAKYKDIQRFQTIPVPGLTPLPGIRNAAAATIYGGQLDVLLKPVEQLDLRAAYGYLHTKYDSFSNPILGDQSGSAFAQAPEHTVNLAATWTQPLSEGELVANASYSYISSQFFLDANAGSNTSRYPGYGLVDLRLDWRGIGIGGNLVDVGVWAKNLTNKRYPIEVNDITDVYGYVGTLFAEPRTYGVQARVRFGGGS